MGMELGMAQTRLLPLKLLLLFPALACLSSGETQVARVNEPATFSCDYNIPKKEMTNYRVYWQNAERVVQAYVPGKKIEELIDPSYVNRTTAIDLSNNLSVTILSLQVPDEGTYECIVQKLVGGQYKRVHKLDVKLSIRADFSDPNILMHEGELSQRITCSSSKGYPQPKLFWLKDGKELASFNTTIFQDPTTRLYSIDSELCVNQTNNFSLTCLITYGDFQVSTNVTLKRDVPPEPTLQPSIIASIVISICFFFIALILYLKRHHCQCPTWLFFRMS
ncbi:T-lymphocyte activation antigen CD80 isoform X2 [Phascolarctos cinereus]|uniref:T-lymphocyte activation antigen CD80 isoform X2 n=1 Tax=Phascolarctos cinereus TaxID=38626 RepID=A0A6P5KAC4_PHACI|nr:T-lymphocyte activation antigen CD80 isoform X2 [Phascolarctos cinereus]